MLEQLKLTARILRGEAGIYEAGDAERCYCKLFVTNSGYVMPVNQRVITEEDLLEIYAIGFEDGQRATVWNKRGALEEI